MTVRRLSRRCWAIRTLLQPWSRELFRLVQEQLSWLGWPWRWRSWRSSPALLRGQHGRHDGRWAVGRRFLLGDGLGHLAQFQPVPFEHSLGHFTQVVQAMPPIRDLKRLRSGKPCCLHVGLSAIPTQDSDLGMRAQPGRRCCGGALAQKIHDPVPLEVDQDRATPAIDPAQRKVVNPDDPQR